MDEATVDEATLEPSPPRNDGFWTRIIAIVSVLISAAVAFLILGPRPAGTQGALDVSLLPTVNASFNAITTVLLLVGFGLIRNQRMPRALRIQRHRRVMLTAFASSTAFLVSYVIYHWFKAGPKAYVGDYRGLYLAILLSHIALAAIIIPLALFTLYRGWTGAIAKHRKIAKITFPIWLYVSITGVLIYGMLYW